MSWAIRITTNVFLALASCANCTQASTIFSNFSANSPGYSNSGFGVSAAFFSEFPFPVPSFNGWAMGFTLTQGATADRAVLPLTFMKTGQLRVTLMASSSTGAPGAVLDSFVLNSGPISEVELYSGTFSNAPVLSADVPYWLMATIEGIPGDVTWRAANPFRTGLGLGPTASRSTGTFPPNVWTIGEWEQAAFQLESGLPTAVPEPATFVLAGTAVALVALARQARHWRTRHVHGSSTTLP